MLRWSFPALVVLYAVVWPGTVNGTYLGPLMGTDVDGDRGPLVDQITALIEKIDKQEDRLQTVETQLAKHTVALVEKDKRIARLELELADIKSRGAPSYITSQSTTSNDRYIGDEHQNESETNQSGIDQRISDQNRRNIINHNGTTQGRLAQNHRVRNTDQSYDLDIENGHTGEKTPSLDVNFKRRLNNQKAKEPDVITEIGQPLATKQRNKRVDNKSPEWYAFSLSLSRSTNVVHREIIKYDNVMLDMGNGYNHGNGIYEVPASGVYVFTWSTTSATNNGLVLYTDLLVNGVVQLPIDVDSDSNNYVSATGLILTSVNAGDHIYIRAMSASQVISFEYVLVWVFQTRKTTQYYRISLFNDRYGFIPECTI